MMSFKRTMISSIGLNYFNKVDCTYGFELKQMQGKYNRKSRIDLILIILYSLLDQVQSTTVNHGAKF